MFNEERKLAFIKHQEIMGLQTYRYKRLFDRISSSESLYYKDVCEMSNDELSITMDVFNTPSIRGSKPTLSALRNYAKWCKENGYNVSDDCFSFRFSQDKVIKQSLVGSPSDLSFRLNELYGAVCGTTKDIPQTLLWLAFIGIPSKEAYLIKNKEIDFNNGFILHNGRYYAFPKESVPAFISVSTRKEFLVGKSNGGAYMRKRADNDFILRSFKDSDQDKDKYYDSVVRNLASDRRNMLTYENVKTSGLYYKIYQSKSYTTPKLLRNTIKEICLMQAKEQMLLADKIVTEDGIKKNRVAMSHNFKNWLRVFHPDDYYSVFAEKSD